MGLPAEDHRDRERLNPKVRLCRLKVLHVRAIELIRAIHKCGRSTANVFSPDIALELSRRGVVDPMTAVVKMRHGNYGLTASGRYQVSKALSFVRDLGLVEPVGRTRNLYRVTKDGIDTLRHWDDPDADGVFTR